MNINTTIQAKQSNSTSSQSYSEKSPQFNFQSEWGLSEKFHAEASLVRLHNFYDLIPKQIGD